MYKRQFENKTTPDFSKELQLDLGEKTITQFEEKLKGIENVFWNGPLGAYDHPLCSSYAEGSLEIAKLLFRNTILNPNISIVIGGGDSGAAVEKAGVASRVTHVSTGGGASLKLFSGATLPGIESLTDRL